MSLDFAGRVEELRATVDALEQAPSVVLIEGEAGVGKSRLLDEAAKRVVATGVEILRGWCHPLREPLPFGPVIDALRQAHPPPDRRAALSPATSMVTAHVPELAEWLPGPDHLPAGPSGPQLARAIHEVLAALGPVLLAIEDVHWADEATRELLLLLARNTPAQLRLLLTYRRHDLPEHGNVLGSPYRRPTGTIGLDLRLGPLDQAQVTQLAAQVIGPAQASVLGPQLFERSAGLPLAIEEDLWAIADRLDHADGSLPATVLEHTGVPRALQEAIGSRVATLPRSAVAVVQAAAILAVPAGQGLLTRLAGLEEDQAEEALEAALVAGVVVEVGPDRYAFHHTLARQAVYERILGPRRTRLHRQAIEALDSESRPPLVQLAHHARQLGDPALWVPRTVAAARYAIEVGDDGITAEQLNQLFAEPTLSTATRTWAAIELSRIAVRNTNPEATVATLRQIIADANLPKAVRGEVRLNLGRTLLNHLDPQGAVQLELAVSELEVEQPEQAAIALASLKMGQWPSDTRERYLAGMQRATEIVQRGTDPVARATVLASQVSLMHLVGDPAGDDLLDQLPRESANLDILRQRCRALYNSADNFYLRGLDERASTSLDEAEELAELTDYQMIAHECVKCRLYLDFARGHWNGLADKADAIIERSTEPVYDVELVHLLALLDTARGRWSNARSALAFCLARDMPVGYLASSAALGRLDLLEGRPDDAWLSIREALQMLRHRDIWVCGVGLLPVAVEAGLAAGHRAQAEELTDQAEAGTADLDAPAAQAEVLVCRGLLDADSAPGTAMDLIEQAQRLLAAIPRPYLAAQVTEHAGRILLATSPVVAGAHLQRAMDAFTGLGATADVSRCQRTLRNVGQDRPVPRGRHSYGTDLSPREQQVADLLGTGATNKDIARALALSVRTAEHHVASVLRKLDTTRDAMTTRPAGSG
ncbi:AAA family ATPase [Kitasatospora sp. NPDC001603]|uniref:ATP-binding protein n=1 Tax=Kitasatospora sp. NPDC001603 TaxID=3154388 RepID=UPI00332D034F